MARIALMYSSVFGSDAYESLLSFMRTEKNDILDEVTSDFVEIYSKMNPPIDIVCVWEMVSMDYSQMLVDGIMKRGPLQYKAFKASAKAVLDVGGMFKTEAVSRPSPCQRQCPNIFSVFRGEGVCCVRRRSQYRPDCRPQRPYQV